MRGYVSLAVFLAAAWVLWSFHFTPLLLGLGAASIVLVLYLVHRMRVVDEEAALVDLVNVRTALYVPWLLAEVIRANLAVARLILHPRLPISPRMIRVPAEQKSALGKVLYANSITLTPGTVTVDVDEHEGTLLVHALTTSAAEGLESGEMGRRVAALEGD